MTRHTCVFLLIAFAGCLAVMLVGFGLLLQASVAAQVIGFALAEAAFVFALVYFIVLPGRRMRQTRRLSASDTDFIRKASLMGFYPLRHLVPPKPPYVQVTTNNGEFRYDFAWGRWVSVATDDAPAEPLTPCHIDEEE